MVPSSPPRCLPPPHPFVLPQHFCLRPLPPWFGPCNKQSKAPARNDGDATPRPKLSKEVLRTLNSAKGVLMSVDSVATPPNRNLHKKYLMVPRSLPSKLVMDVQRERWQVCARV